jgi:hypothetical protein
MFDAPTTDPRSVNAAVQRPVVAGQRPAISVNPASLGSRPAAGTTGICLEESPFC